MTYDELLDKWIRKLGRPCTAGEIVHDLRQLEQPVRCKDCRFHEHEEPGMVWCPNVVGSWMEEEGYCSFGERREDEMR